MSDYPLVLKSVKLQPGVRRVYIGAYGFEDRALGWVNLQKEQSNTLTEAFVFRYVNPKGANRVVELQHQLKLLGANVVEIEHDPHAPHNVENDTDNLFSRLTCDADEVVLDISAMTKLLALVCLCHLSNFAGILRLVYSEPEEYAPSQEQYAQSKEEMGLVASFPSRGIQSLVRLSCLSSVRMQGQPVLLIAFASFNEQLVRHMLGTISPYRLLFINGKPPRKDFAWREHATQEIHEKILAEYLLDNPVSHQGKLIRTTSTLDYRGTIREIDKIYRRYGNSERIICAATGSKMQTVGLFFSKIEHPDIHIEYPTPDSYFVTGMSIGIRSTHEVTFLGFAGIIKSVSSQQDPEVIALAKVVDAFG